MRLVAVILAAALLVAIGVRAYQLSSDDSSEQQKPPVVVSQPTEVEPTKAEPTQVAGPIELPFAIGAIDETNGQNLSDCVIHFFAGGTLPDGRRSFTGPEISFEGEADGLLHPRLGPGEYTAQMGCKGYPLHVGVFEIGIAENGEITLRASNQGPLVIDNGVLVVRMTPTPETFPLPLTPPAIPSDEQST
jgi:hypothetical protein